MTARARRTLPGRSATGMLRRMTFDLRSSVTVWVLLCAAACSDDGVPADETTGAGDSGDAAEASASASATDPTTQTTSVTATDTSPSTTDDPTNSTATDTDPGNDTTGDATGPGETSTGESSGSSDSGSSDSSSSDSSSSDSSSSTDESGNAGAPVGDPCVADGDCSTGICWDFSDYDALCSGTACSGPCDTDEDCAQLILDAGGAYPDESFCGEDGRCSMIGTGFGAFACQ
jgi:hypothetical protein